MPRVSPTRPESFRQVIHRPCRRRRPEQSDKAFTDTHLSDDHRAPLSDDFAPRTGATDLPRGGPGSCAGFRLLAGAVIVQWRLGYDGLPARRQRHALERGTRLRHRFRGDS